MKAMKVSREILERAASMANVRAEIETIAKSGRTHRVKLRLVQPPSTRTANDRQRRGPKGDSPFQKYGSPWNGKRRRIAAVCWHGFRDFFRAVYILEPSAVFVTALARYEGSNGFESVFPATGETNIGSAYQPFAAQDACHCEDDGGPETLHDYGPGEGQYFGPLARAAAEKKRRNAAKLALAVGPRPLAADGNNGDTIRAIVAARAAAVTDFLPGVGNSVRLLPIDGAGS